ncbi:Vacuolar protein [Nesidiocoris tenuis]|uniref:Vacuolar protein n=1 Tax=Nesidiocoris tenuis TaxID=355587 RepID=A0ABN7ATY6_9HEMI|nr:Vacuolar protein [Nesidiocoris tenuis]
MVFESVLIEVVNKYIGNYVENLNADQLKVGIWGGNVVVENLALRPGTFDELNLPVKTVFGHLGKLTLQIPWKDLYNSPVKVEVERLYVLVVPNSDIKYDPGKDAKFRQDEKMAEVKKVEKAKKLELEKARPKQTEPSTFAEKLTANIIKNVQVTLKDIHIRFEDKFSNPGKTYAAGFTLDLLQVNSIPRWGEDVAVDPANLIFKQLVISSFAVYWNSNCSDLYSERISQCLQLFKSRLDNSKAEHVFNCMLGPINSTTLLRYNSKPEQDNSNFTVPKWLLVSDFKELSLSMNKSQFQDLMGFIEGLEMMRRAGLYRKYRPNVPSYRGHYKEWWKFAYTCVVEEEVKRKLKNWDWNQMKQHRANIKAYYNAYTTKMSSARPTVPQLKACEQLEAKLDALNLILVRQRVELELERQQQRSEKSSPKTGGWFSGWWGASTSDKDSTSTEDNDTKLVNKLENAMTADEKAKLYKAIGYKEGDVPLEYPKSFVEFCFVFTLDSLSVNVMDDSVQTALRKVLLLQLSGVRMNIDVRPTSMTVATFVHLFTVVGTKQNGVVPQLVSIYDSSHSGRSKSPKKDQNLLEVYFDKNPLDSLSDMRVVVKTQPLLVVFDAKTISDIQSVFDTSKPIAANQIQAAVQMKLTEIKTMSATGLQHMVHERKIVELDFDLKASTLILPEKGFYSREKGSTLVVSLGNIKVSSNPQDRNQMSEELENGPSAGHPDFVKLLDQCYDNYSIQLTDLQVVYALEGEVWETEDGKLPDIMYFLRPSTLTVVVRKCIIQDDPRIPQFKVNGSLDGVNAVLAEKRLKDFAKLIVSIPMGDPKQQPAAIEEMPIFDSTFSMSMALNQEQNRPKHKDDPDELHQFKELELEFNIHEITTTIVDDDEKPLLFFRLHSLGVTVTKDTFDQHILAELGGVSLRHSFQGKEIPVFNSLTFSDKEYLFSIEFIMVNRKSPDFRSKYASTLQTLLVDFTHLEVCANAEAILDLLQRLNEFTKIFEKPDDRQSVVTTKSRLSPSVERKSSVKALPRTASAIGSKTGRSSASSKSSRSDVIDLKLSVNIGGIAIKLENQRKAIMRLCVKGGESNIIVRKAYTMLEFNLNGIEVINLESTNMYSKIITVVDETRALKTSIVIFNGEKDSTSTDLKITAEFARTRVVFLNSFVSSVLDFLDNFQVAQEKLVEASQAAAEVAKLNVQEAYTNAAKAELSLDLKAPVVYVPINESSKDVFIIDLGCLNISNIIVEIKCKENQTAALDRIKLNLDEMKLIKASINEDFSVVDNTVFEIIERVSFKLTVQRNLSSGWYTDIPDLEILCEIPAIKIHINRKNYLLLLKMLDENIGATANQKDTVSIKTPHGQTKAVRGNESNITNTVSAVSRNVTRDIIDEEESDELKITPPLAVRTSIKFSFSLESVVVDVGLPTDEATPSILAKLTLHVLSLRGSLLSDGSIQTSILLVDLALDDLRDARANKINCYMLRKETAEMSSSEMTVEPVKNVLDVVYQKTGTTTFANVRISSFILILNVEYLSLIASVFTMPVKPAATPIRKLSPAAVSTAQSVDSRSSKVSVVKPPAMKSTEGETQVVNVLNFNFKCEQPDIILVEHMDDIDTNALILHAEIEVKGRFQDEKQFVSGSILDLQVFSCCFNPQKRKKTKIPVLRPFSIILAGNSPDQPGLNLDICTTPILLSVSPGTISLLSNISSAMAVKVDQDESTLVQDLDRSKMWSMSRVKESDYYFLQTKVADEAISAQEFPMADIDDTVVQVKHDSCSLTVPSVVITLDSGTGKNTMPLLKLEAKIQASLRQWSSQPNVECQLFVEMSYYNSQLALWEPVLEPVESKDSEGREIFTPWELFLQLDTVKDVSLDETLESPTGEAAEVHYVKKIHLSSKDFMHLTVTKTCLDVLTALGASFQEAYYHPTEFEGEKPTFELHNDTGYNVTVHLASSPFKPWGIEDPEGFDQVQLSSGGVLELQELKTAEKNKKETQDEFLNISIPTLNFTLVLPVSRADKRYFTTNTRGASNDYLGVVSEVRVINGCTYVTLRSIIQIRNKFSVPVSVYFMTRKGNELELVGVVQPKGYLNVPLEAVYTPTCELFFSVENYSVSLQPFVWKDLQKTLETSMLMKCDPKRVEDKEPFFIRASGEMEQIYYESSMRHTMASQSYNIYIRPTVIFKNLLPVDVICNIQGMLTEPVVEKGESIQVLTAEPGSSTIVVRIPDYLNREWVCKHLIEDEGPELAVWTFETYESPQKFTLELGVHTLKKNETVIMELYCPFWMLNKTGLLLSYKRSSKADKEIADSPEQAQNTEHVLYHPANFVGPIMFSFKAKSFFAKKKSQIRVESGQWSDKFSLDVVGSSGSVSCHNKNMKFDIGISIQLSYSTLTKMVVFTPFYVVMNNWPIDLEFQEQPAHPTPSDPWFKVPKNECVPFWPVAKHSNGLKVRVAGTAQSTVAFSYTSVFNGLFKLDNKYGAINVDVQITEGGTYIGFHVYEVGLAPALIINHTSHAIQLQEKALKKDTPILLPPFHQMLFTWESGAIENEFLAGLNKLTQIKFKHDNIGRLDVHKGEIYWVSFLYGLQRVLLFTPYQSIAKDAQNLVANDITESEIEVQINGISLSLVDNVNKVEVLHLGITSTGVVWQSKKSGKKHYKPLTDRESTAIETAYQEYKASRKTGIFKVDNRIMIDFGSMLMTKPVTRDLRRAYKTGLWISIVTSRHTLQFHLKINRVQIDNQMFECVFPVVLAPVPPPKTVSTDTAEKPFVEVSIVKRLTDYSVVQQFKYFKVLVQEFQIKVDTGFINALLSLVEKDETYNEKAEALGFKNDLKLKDEPLQYHVTSVALQDQKHFYDYLHLSPLKFHLSFTLSGQALEGSNTAFVGTLLQSFGVTLTDVQGVVFKLAYLEKEHCFLTRRQLLAEVQTHYVSQLIKQLYVLVLGLDVIGNPYGLFVGLGHGAKDLFYEPFQGAIQGPGEFATGLAYGMRSLFGHTVGGAAGAVSKITGAMGKGLAALTFDKEYQKDRLEMYSHQPANLQEGLAQSGKGLVMGVFHGVTGVVSKPISGAKEEGVQGFFKGAGKGLVGLVTRPTAGIVDFASGSFNAVKRATDISGETVRMRPPRFIQNDGHVLPFSKRVAEGHKLLKDVDKGKYATTDVYVFHTTIGQQNQDFLLITDKRIGYICVNEIFGGFQMDWSHTWAELEGPPTIAMNGVKITIGKKKGMRSVFQSSSQSKVLLVESYELQKQIVNLIGQLMREALSAGNSQGSLATSSSPLEPGLD